jgi:hypothetical protein
MNYQIRILYVCKTPAPSCVIVDRNIDVTYWSIFAKHGPKIFSSKNMNDISNDGMIPIRYQECFNKSTHTNHGITGSSPKPTWYCRKVNTIPTNACSANNHNFVKFFSIT